MQKLPWLFKNTGIAAGQKIALGFTEVDGDSPSLVDQPNNLVRFANGSKNGTSDDGGMVYHKYTISAGKCGESIVFGSFMLKNLDDVLSTKNVNKQRVKTMLTNTMDHMANGGC